MFAWESALSVCASKEDCDDFLAGPGGAVKLKYGSGALKVE